MSNAAFKLHPWNRDFSWNSVSALPSALSPDQTAAFDNRGFFVIEDLLDQDTLAEVVDEIDALEAETEAALRAFEDERLLIGEAGAITFSPHLVSRSNLLRQVAAEPRIASICVDLIGPDVNLYWDQAVYKKPEKPRRFPWHQDNGYTYVEPQQYLTVWLALNDATIENGCPWVAPGVHRAGTLAHSYVDPLGFECFEQFEAAEPAPVPAGGAAVFSSLTPHLTGPNTTTEVRKSYILQYAPQGAEVLTGDPTSGPPTGRVACDAPERQFPITRAGSVVVPEPI
ncbi:MAG: phytanoyl-CoA dioxygenase family protein [Acidimicrobiaceae bacterium]|nr:phytanoyl-CoA dioxygenase family protein [Acidimicrobiaceae bacterium]